MHLPVNMSLSGTLTCLTAGFCASCRACAGDTASSSADSKSFVISALRFFFPENKEGNGWLLDLPCPEGLPFEVFGFGGVVVEE